MESDDDIPVPPKRKTWRRGVDMPEFSGRTWAELNDIWPQDVRVSSEIWKAMSVFPAALVQNERFQKALLNGQKINIRELFQLMWVMRCEEVKEDVGTEEYWMANGRELSMKLLRTRQGQLVKLGLIEQISAPKLRLYRVSPLGRVIIRNLIEEMDKAHQNIKKYAEEQPEEGKKNVDQFLQKYCFNPVTP